MASKDLVTYSFLDIEFDNLNGERKFNTQHAYYHSKLALVMVTYDLAQRLRGSGVKVNEEVMGCERTSGRGLVQQGGEVNCRSSMHEGQRE